MWKYSLSWFALLVFAIANAAIREVFLRRYWSEYLSHQISVFTGILILTLPIFFISKVWPYSSKKQAIQVGLLWAFITQSFELGMMLSAGKSILDFVDVNNLLKGQFWILIPLWLFISPYLFSRFLLRKDSNAL